MAVSIDPGTLLVMRLSSELMDARATIKAQRRQILAMAVALRTAQMGSAALVDLLDTLLSTEAGDA